MVLMDLCCVFGSVLYCVFNFNNLIIFIVNNELLFFLCCIISGCRFLNNCVLMIVFVVLVWVYLMDVFRKW